MNRNVCVWFCIGLAPVTLVFSGCGSNTTYEKTQYILDPVRTADPAAVPNTAVLEVRRFTMDSAFQGKSLVYRTSDQAYETDFYHEFLAPPASMIREATRNWLAQSNLFARVADTGGYVEPTYALEANITTLYGDTRDQDAPKAVVELRAFLLKVEGSGDPVILQGQVYSVTREAPAADPDGLVAGFNACLQVILGDLEKDVAATL
jgi:cholesterol transport system auxiliary component